jgi:hypothetical protein
MAWSLLDLFRTRALSIFPKPILELIAQETSPNARFINLAKLSNSLYFFFLFSFLFPPMGLELIQLSRFRQKSKPTPPTISIRWDTIEGWWGG